MRDLSIRWRLSILYAVILTAVLGTFGIFVYKQQESFLINNAASRLDTRGTEALAAVPKDAALLSDPAVRRGVLARTAAAPADSAILLRVDGTVIDSSTSADPLEATLNAATYMRAAQGTVARQIVHAGGGGRMLAVLVPARDADGRVVALVQVNGSLDSVDAALLRLQLLLWTGILVAHVLGTGLGFAVTSWSLRPLGNLIETSRSVADGSYGERVGLPRTGDELGQIAAAFDNMLDEVQSTIEARERSEQLTRQFAADASHELKSPLTVLIGYLGVLLRGEHADDAQLKRALRGMEREAERMSAVVSDLVTLAHLESGGRGPASAIDLGVLVDELRDEGQMRSNAHRFLRGGLDTLTVSADAEGVRRGVRNLLENAIRHTPAGGTITLGLERSGGTAAITVTDNGEGIDSRHLPYVFNRFYRVDGARARGEGSAGLGLAITRAVAAANGGSIHVESELGKGSVFTLRLPLTEPNPLGVSPTA